MYERREHISRRHQALALRDDYIGQAKRYMMEAFDSAVNNGHSLHKLNVFVSGCLSNPKLASMALEHFDVAKARSESLPFVRGRRLAKLSATRLTEDQRAALFHWYTNYVAMEMVKYNVMRDEARLMQADVYT